MRRRTVAFQLACLAVLSLFQHSAAGGEITLPPQSTSPGLIATDWFPPPPVISGLTDPLTFDQFNPSLGTLTAINITLATEVLNDYNLVFQSPTTIYVATSSTSDPSVLTDPVKRAMLTDGPTVTLYGPDGITPILAARNPVDFVQRTVQSGTFPVTFSSSLPVTDPNRIPPTDIKQSLLLPLAPANGLLFADFIGTGNVDLPVKATAFSSFFMEGGSGGGGVTTTANATVTIEYLFSVPSIPEPSSAILLGLGIGIGILATRLRRRGTSRRE
jgi:PEP-CTERM motif